MIIPLKGGEEVKNDERGERGLRYENQTHPQYSCDVYTAQQQKQVCGSAWQVSSAWLLREMGLLPGQPEPPLPLPPASTVEVCQRRLWTRKGSF